MHADKDQEYCYRKKILLLADWFAPGYKAGGPIRSCLHFVQHMKERYDCFVLTSDRDLNDTEPYIGIEVNRWIDFEPGVQIFYCSPKQLAWRNILQQIRSIKPDFTYLNSMYSRYFTIYPLLMHRMGLINTKIVLSPRGMLRETALQFRRAKKKIFLSLLKQSGIHKMVHFHATDETEEKDIRKQFGQSIPVTMAPNLAGVVSQYPGTIVKIEGQLSLIFVGRLHPIKNLDFLLLLLPMVPGNIKLTIVGSEEDKAFVVQCKSYVEKYPSRIRVSFVGELPNHRVPELIRQHHIFALPTQGENFGHAIFEALSIGKPVLISDQTPWRQLEEKKAGWDIDLGKKDLFINAMQRAVNFDQQQYHEWSVAAWRLAKEFSQRPETKNLYYNLFR